MFDRFFKKTICEVCVVSTYFLKGNTSLLGGGFTVMRSTNYSFLEKNVLNKKTLFEIFLFEWLLSSENNCIDAFGDGLMKTVILGT